MTELREWLESAGFKFGIDSLRYEGNECDWYAYRRTAIPSRECECNDGKAMQIIIKPSQFAVNGKQYKTASVEVCGEYDGQWWRLEAYGVDTDKFPEKFDAIERSLISAWNALGASFAAHGAIDRSMTATPTAPEGDT